MSFSSVQLHLTLCDPWTAACQALLSITNSLSLLKLMSIEQVMPSNHLILSHPLLLPPPIFTSITVFSNESVLHIRWPKYWSFSFNMSPSNEHSGLISFRMDQLDLLGLSRVFSNTTVQIHQSFGAQLSCIGEGNGNPLQCSCLENPRDGEPSGLPSLGSHRVGHDCSDLAAAFFRVQLLHPYMTTGKNHSFDQMDLCWQSNVSAFEYAIYVVHNFPSKEKASFKFHGCSHHLQ